MKNRRDFIRYTGLAGLGLAGARLLHAGSAAAGTNPGSLFPAPGVFSGEDDKAYEPALTFTGKKVFIEAGKPVSVTGNAVRDIYTKGNELIIPFEPSWGNSLFADASLTNNDFHVHARMTLEKLASTGASFLFGGHYHYPCLRPEANVTFRVSLDDDHGLEGSYELDPGTGIAYGMTEQRDPWYVAEKTIASRAAAHITPGIPFELDFVQKGDTASFRINGNEVFRTSLQDKIYGHGDAGWPACLGFYPCRGNIRLQEFYAEGTFTDGSLPHQDVWNFGTDGYLNYRIPAICVTPGGTILAFAEARRFDWCRARDWNKRLHDEVDCVMKRSMDGGRTWSEQVMVMQRGNVYEARNPSAVVDRETGDVFLVLSGPYLTRITDEGRTLSEPRLLTELLGNGRDRFSTGPCQGIQLRYSKYKGRLVIPFASRGRIGVIYSDDHGASWKMGSAPGKGSVEPHAVELNDGRILLNYRNTTDDPGRLIYISSDGGSTFPEHYADERLTSKTCLASMVRYEPLGSRAGGQVPILYCGPGEIRSRRNIRIVLSYDDCRSWPVSSPVIYSGHTAYSGMTVLPDGQIGVLYEKDGYRRLAFVRFPLSWVTGQKNS